MNAQTTPLSRVLTALQYQEADRVPYFFPLTMWGAKFLGMGIKEYFSKAEHVAEAQVLMRERFGHDLMCNLTYAAAEVEAWGGEVIFTEDGPPNAGTPIIQKRSDIDSLMPPNVESSVVLRRTLHATTLMRERAGADVPIIGVVMSPFSVAVMQMGFPDYLELIYEEPEAFWRLMEKNIAFCVSWANAQLRSGATAIGYFDPVSSPTCIPAQLYRDTGKKVAMTTIAAIEGPVATHLASGRCIEVLGDIAETGAGIIGASALEGLDEVKKAAAGKLAVLGNLNALQMRSWSDRDVEQQVKTALALGGPGGGFILGDNHGDIPWQVPQHVLEAIGTAVQEWGRYPLTWADEFVAAKSADGR